MLEENKELGQQAKEIAILNDINSFFCLVPVHFLSNLQHGGIVVPHDWLEAKNLNMMFTVTSKKVSNGRIVTNL